MATTPVALFDLAHGGGRDRRAIAKVTSTTTNTYHRWIPLLLATFLLVNNVSVIVALQSKSLALSPTPVSATGMLFRKTTTTTTPMVVGRTTSSRQQQQFEHNLISQHRPESIGKESIETTTTTAVSSKVEQQQQQQEAMRTNNSTAKLLAKVTDNIAETILFQPTMFTANSSAAEGECQSNCSGHGDCYNGTCFCEVEYSGWSCQDPNLKYYASFSSVYYLICVVSFVQLVLCINSELSRQKPRKISLAFTISTQKALYFFICMGTAIRGYYFSSPTNVNIRWAESLMSAYYPILMSGSSLLVCFWAEVFHLDVSVERSRFLSKSITGFIMFNVVTYSLLLAELVLLLFANPSDSDKNFFMGIFYSIYAFLMLIVVIFFLIYGVEVYFKVRGAFIQGETCSADASQLQQSRLGLISLAVLNLVTILFLMSEVCGPWWKTKVPVLSRNYHQVMFRVVEFGMALWFPCVLWNCIKPEQLWILNPRRILKRRTNFFHIDDNSKIMGKSVAESELLVGGSGSTKKSMLSMISNTAAGPECWICYETMESKPEAGQLIQPCECKGDVSAVHHECLLRWLMETYTRPNCQVFCKVCGVPYRVVHSSKTVWLPAGLTISHWFKTAAILTVMGITIGVTCLVVKIFEHMYVKMISVGLAILIVYICFRLLGFNMISAYHRAKFSAIKIIGRKITFEEVAAAIESNQSLAGTSNDVASGSGAGAGAKPKAKVLDYCCREQMMEGGKQSMAEGDDEEEDYYYNCNVQHGGGEPVPSLSGRVEGDDEGAYLCFLVDCRCSMQHLPAEMDTNTTVTGQTTPTGSMTRL